VQRLFSMFPQGGPGFALLLLRISVVATFLLNAGRHLDLSSSSILFASVLFISAFLAIGFLTPFVSSIAGLSAFLNLLLGYRLETLILISLILNSTSLALLGPGAYSLDARLFGRRVMVVPPRKDPN
jgi:hypothetical protein